MDMQTELDITAIQRELQGLSEELKTKALKAGLLAPGKLTVQLLKSNAPVETGNLRKSMRRRQLTDNQKLKLSIAPSSVAIQIGPNMSRSGSGAKGYIANVLEGGARPHIINLNDPNKPKRNDSSLVAFKKAQGIYGNKKRVLSDGMHIFGTRIRHPGTRAYGFIKSSIDEATPQFEGLFYSGVQDYLNRIQV